MRCPHCGGRIEKRWDESAAGLRNRYAYHARQVKKTVQYLARKKIMHVINGEQTRAKVHSDIMKVLKRELL
jgi:adenylate kinase family enzyme